jgi:hypothetical protein
MILTVTPGASPALLRPVQREMELRALADAPGHRDPEEQDHRHDRWRETLGARLSNDDDPRILNHHCAPKVRRAINHRYGRLS